MRYAYSVTLLTLVTDYNRLHAVDRKDLKTVFTQQYLRQLRKAEGGLSGMNTAQAGDLIENLRQ